MRKSRANLEATPPAGDAKEAGAPDGGRYPAEFAPLVAVSPTMQAIARLIQEVAGTTATVLVRGESGVGKDLVARAIHAASPRRDQPYVKVNCAALPADLLESELFGHERGAFTGAYRRTLGKFEYANGGTICLDEIGEMPRSLQAKLLHVLQDLQFSRVGGREPIQVDVRVVATTNKDLETAIRADEFREDLYYRLNVVEIHVPALRERRETIPVLAETFLARFNAQYHRAVELPPDTLRLFVDHAWPGNVRELENTVRRLVVLGDSRRIHEELRARLGGAPPRDAPGAAAPAAAARAAPLDGSLDLKAIARRAARDAERQALLQVLERVRWNRAEAARILKVSYKTLLTKLTECGINRGRTAPPA